MVAAGQCAAPERSEAMDSPTPTQEGIRPKKLTIDFLNIRLPDEGRFAVPFDADPDVFTAGDGYAMTGFDDLDQLGAAGGGIHEVHILVSDDAAPDVKAEVDEVKYAADHQQINAQGNQWLFFESVLLKIKNSEEKQGDGDQQVDDGSLVLVVHIEEEIKIAEFVTLQLVFFGKFFHFA